MVRVLTWSVIDRGFEPRSSQTIDYKIDMRCFSAKHTALQEKAQILVESESVSAWG